MSPILIILILVILFGGLGGSLYTGGYGFGVGSHGIIGLILVIVLVLFLLGRL